MYPEIADNAEKCAAQFLKLMKDRPGYWAENVNDSIMDLKDGDEQIKFLAWMADPQGITNNRKRDIPVRTEFSTETFENHQDYTVTKKIPGKLPVIRVTYTPNNQDDEKVPA